MPKKAQTTPKTQTQTQVPVSAQVQEPLVDLCDSVIEQKNVVPSNKKTRTSRKTKTENSEVPAVELESNTVVPVESNLELVNSLVETSVADDCVSVTSSNGGKDKPELDVIGKQFEGVLTTLTTFRQSITALQTQIRGLEKSVRKEMKGLRKEASKNRAKGNRKPSGFAKPSLVTAELCKFMGKDEGTEIARTEVTQYLIQYIKDNELQFAENKKIIMPDDTLKSLLGVSEGEEVTYFNLQRLMNKHFVKKDKKSNEAAV